MRINRPEYNDTKPSQFNNIAAIYDRSNCPLVLSITLVVQVLGIILQTHNYDKGAVISTLGSITFYLVCSIWFGNIFIECFAIGKWHSSIYASGLFCILLFIASEIMLFLAVFWSYLHNKMLPSIHSGNTWPTPGIHTLDIWGLPLAITLLLLLAAGLITMSHNQILQQLCHRQTIGDIEYNKLPKIYVHLYNLAIAILVIGCFLVLQGYEYFSSSFDISDSVYASAFYFATSIHGIHVMVAGIWLIVVLAFIQYDTFTYRRQLCYTAAVWYFHFTDVVWLFLFIVYYILTVYH